MVPNRQIVALLFYNSHFYILFFENTGGKIVGKIADIGDQARPAIRAIWFLYTERLTRMKDASEQSRIDTIIAEAVLATDARRAAAASPKNVFFMIVSFLALVCSMQS